jgi:peptidoglycan/LPS O-acetylase OafA/YrhL
VNRVLRILPAFLFCILICALLIGPVFSSAGIQAYFSDSAILDYLRSSIDNFSDMRLPGLFAYDADLAKVVNGSLWSLRYEALSYVLLLLLWTVFRASGLVAGVIIVIATLTRISPAVNGAITGIAFTLPYFATGVLMNWIHTRFGNTQVGSIDLWSGAARQLLFWMAAFRLRPIRRIPHRLPGRAPKSPVSTHEQDRRLFVRFVFVRLAGGTDSQATDKNDQSVAAHGHRSTVRMLAGVRFL